MATQETLNDYYRAYYSTGHHASFTSDQCDTRLGAARQTIGKIRAHVPSGRLLDVGCGSGQLCKAAMDAGYDVYGVDVSPSGIEFAREHFSLANVYCSELLDCQFQSGFFNVVHCWHLVEHVLDPVGLLKEIHRILAPGGILYWGTDNHRSIGYAIHRATCFLSGRIPPIYDGVEHTYGFDPRTIRRALEESGFGSLSVRTYPDEFSVQELRQDLRVGGVGKAIRTAGQMIFRIKMEGVAYK